MDPEPTHRELSREEGFATVEHVGAVALALVFFCLLANLIVMQYTMAAVTGALDEGARVGARTMVGSELACRERVGQSVAAILAAPVAETLTVRCWSDGAAVHAEAEGLLRGWLPAVPDVHFRRVAVSPIEPFEVE